MSFGTLSNLYVIGRYLDDSFFTESFKSSDVFSDYIADQTFTREIISGGLDLSAFNDTSETFYRNKNKNYFLFSTYIYHLCFFNRNIK